jgi:ribosome biogenesis protein ERB1
VKNAAWHFKGDYFVSVLDDKTSNNTVIIHQLSKQKSITPFAKMKGIVQQVKFHPIKPILFVAVSVDTSFSNRQLKPTLLTLFPMGLEN